MADRSTGHVVFISRNAGMLVVQNANGFALVEMLGNEGEIPLGAAVSADWDAVAGEPMFANGMRYDVYLQGNMSREQAIRLARQSGG